jgi:hypothetical protein
MANKKMGVRLSLNTLELPLHKHRLTGSGMLEIYHHWTNDGMNVIP